MRRVLKVLWPVALLALSACNMIPGLLGTAASAAAAASGATAAADPSATDPSASTTTTTTTTGAATTTTPAPVTPAPTTSATKSITFDTTKKLEYVDVWVNMSDPSGQRALVPYLMKPKDWMLVGCEMTSTTSKHYRFMKVSSTDGKELPDVDIYKGR
jgi:hypothetical protein